MGPLNETYNGLTDATWNEKLAAVILLSGILLMGIAPFLINQLIAPATTAIMEQVGSTMTTK